MSDCQAVEPSPLGVQWRLPSVAIRVRGWLLFSETIAIAGKPHKHVLGWTGLDLTELSLSVKGRCRSGCPGVRISGVSNCIAVLVSAHRSLKELKQSVERACCAALLDGVGRWS
jgi:hypothetical protein